MYTEKLQQTSTSMEISNYQKLSTNEKLAMNNRRWVDLSKEHLEKTQKNKTMSAIRITVGWIAFSSFIAATIGLGYYSHANQLPVLGGLAYYSLAGETLISTFFTAATIKNVKEHYEENKNRLDPSQTENVINIYNEILNGNAKNNRIKYFGILSNEVFIKYKVLTLEKDTIENKYKLNLRNMNLQNTVAEEMLKLNEDFKKDMDDWSEKWSRFKPELEADLPDLTHINDNSLPV